VPRFAVDLTAVRESRDLRLVLLGQALSALGTQAALVAVPYQVYVLTHSAALVGLLGVVELGPLIAASLWAARSPTASTAAGCCWRPSSRRC
jgi:hypothetical protein